MPDLFVLAGPNGAGKSTYFTTALEPRLGRIPFVNPDTLIRQDLGRPALTQDEMRRGQALADEQREGLRSQRSSFVMETVFSHPSKLDLLRDCRSQGYAINVIHIGVETADISVGRVAMRVSQDDGHPVPEDRIRNRFARNQPFIRHAVLMADRGLVVDNSALNRPHRQVLVFRNGRVVAAAEPVPAWIGRLYAQEIIQASRR